MSKLFARINKATKPVKMKNMENHNLRKKDCPKADMSKSNLNTYEGTKDIVKYVKAKEKECNAALKKAGKRKIRKDANLLFECVVAPGEQEFFEKYDDVKFFQDVDEFFKGYISEECIAQKSIHRDELTYHAHYLIIPYFEEGINYNKYFANPEMCSKFQQALFDYLSVQKGYEFEGRELAKNTKRKHKEVKEWYKEVGKSSNMVEALTDENKKTDYAIKGVLADSEKSSLEDKISYLSVENDLLEMKIGELEEEKAKLVQENSLLKSEYEVLYRGVESALKGDRKHKKEQIENIKNIGRITVKKEREMLQEQRKDDEIQKTENGELER